MAKLLFMATSLRKESLNKKLIQQVFNHVEGLKKHDCELLSLNDFTMPLYDGDLEATEGLPNSTKKLAEKIKQADGFIFSTPEYNGSMPGVFKNMFDWVSRVQPMPWHGKHILLLGTSPGGLGAIRGLAHARVPFDAIGAFVYPEMYALARGHQAFDAEGKFKDPETAKRVQDLTQSFLNYLES